MVFYCQAKRERNGHKMLNIEEYEAMVMLDLPAEGRELLTRRLNALADTFTALEKIDTGSVEPLVTVLTRNNVLREDVSEKRYSRDEILANAPEQSDGYFKVPGTL